MSTDRIEPSIDHEFTLEITSVIDHETGTPMLQFLFRTVREFASFGYSINVKDASKPVPTEYTFELGGLSLPSHTSHAFGGAQTVVRRALPADGVYRLTIRRRARRFEAQITVAGGIPESVTESDQPSFIRVEVSRG